MKNKLTLLIVDDHPVFRRGLRDIIQEHTGFKILGEASEGRSAIKLAAELKPDIIILDIDMPQLNGLETMRAINQAHLESKVVILTMYKDEDMFNAAMDLGVNAYVLKENASEEILEALEKVSRQETYTSLSIRELGQRRTNRVQELLLNKPQISNLTPAERRIMKLIAEDLTSKEIANKLQISAKTIENHRQNICHKLGLRGSHSLLKFAFEHKAHL